MISLTVVLKTTLCIEGLELLRHEFDDDRHTDDTASTAWCTQAHSLFWATCDIISEGDAGVDFLLSLKANHEAYHPQTCVAVAEDQSDSCLRPTRVDLT